MPQLITQMAPQASLLGFQSLYLLHIELFLSSFYWWTWGSGGREQKHLPTTEDCKLLCCEPSFVSRLCKWKVSRGTGAWLCAEMKSGPKCFRLFHAAVCFVTLPFTTVFRRGSWQLVIIQSSVQVPMGTVSGKVTLPDCYIHKFNSLFAASCNKTCKLKVPVQTDALLMWSVYLQGELWGRLICVVRWSKVFR